MKDKLKRYYSERYTPVSLILLAAIILLVSVSQISADTSPQDKTFDDSQDYSISACDDTCAECTQEFDCWPSSAACFWNMSSTPEVCESDPCGVALDESTCTGLSGCHWADHGGDAVCEIDMGGGLDCAQWDTTGQAECEASSDCTWDSATSLCDPTGGGSCSGQDCEYCNNFDACAGVGCSWNQSAIPPNPPCEPSTGGAGDCDTNCGDCIGYDSCLSSPAGTCDWNPTSFSCYEFTSVGDCQQACPDCSDFGQCESSAVGCFWDDWQGQCMFETGGGGMNCGVYNNTLCGVYSSEGCDWNGTSCTRSACMETCTDCATQDPCFQSPVGCWWDFGKSECQGDTGGGFIETCEIGRCDLCVDQTACDASSNTNCAWGVDEFDLHGDTGERCFMNTTCSSDCFRCTNDAGCATSTDSAFSGGNCSWDPFSLNCYPGDDMGGGDPGGFGQCDQNCSLCMDSFMCGYSVANCGWDSGQNACARDACAGNCSACGDSNDCFMSPVGCNWNSTDCLSPSCDTDCGVCTQFGEARCDSSTADCVWDSNAQLCQWASGNADGCNIDCGTCDSDWQCYGSPKGCAWNYGDNSCAVDNCMTDCSQCGEDNCFNSFAGCFWDHFSQSCAGGAGGGGGACQICAEDCFRCESNSTCGASNDSCFSQSGCTYKLDPMKFMDPWATSNYTCFPQMMGPPGGGGGGFTGEPSCDNICEFCFTNDTCANATPVMAPPPGTCVWDQWDNLCHPEGGMGGPGGGMGSACFMADGTSQGNCESLPGCKWNQMFLLCDPDFDDFGCSSTQGGLCFTCEDSTNCTSLPHCLWDDAGTDGDSADDYCRDNFGPGGGFQFGANCDGMCMDCFNEQNCNQSIASCQWFADPMGFGSGYCDWAGKQTCEENCFECFDQGPCETSTNSEQYSNSNSTCRDYVDEGTCNNAPELCSWNASLSPECDTKTTNYCVWDSSFWFCKPNATIEICFAPGDEDSDGLEGCADPDCSQDPFCFFGPGPGGPGGGGSMGMDINCFQWDEWQLGNQSICENYSNGTSTGCAWHNVPSPMGGMEGLCDPKFMDFVFGGMGEDMPFFIMHDDCTKDPSGGDNLNDSLWLEICDIGIKDMDNTTAFFLDVGSVDDLALCNNMYADSSNGSGIYWWFLDTDDNVGTGCSANVSGLVEGGSTLAEYTDPGFEYALEYVINYTNSNGTLEARTLYECKNSTQNKWGYASATMSGKKDKACKYSGIILGVSKTDIGNPSSTIRINAYSGNLSALFDISASANLVNPADRALNGYFTPGTIDFNPPDCFMNPAACGSGFNIGGGFMNFEDCFPGTGDEDFDGKINCEDEDCYFNPFCAGNSSYDPTNDSSAPSVTSNKVDVGSDYAVLQWSTDEPSNALAMFFWTNSTCENNTENITEFDDPFFTMDDYKPFHMIPLDGNHPDATMRLSATLAEATSYYYKTVSCDQAQYANGTANPNCAISACLNFTTVLPCGDYTNQTACVSAGACNWDNNTVVCNPGFIFDFGFTPPPFTPPTDPKGDITFQLDLGSGWQTFDFSGTSQTFNGSNDVAVRFGNPNTKIANVSMPWWISMFNCSMSGAASINMTNMFAVGNDSNATVHVGLKSEKWYDLQQKLGCGKIWEQIPMFDLDCTASIVLQYCNGTGGSCTPMVGDNATLVECNETGNYTVWELAVTSGIFSSYSVGSGNDTSAPNIYGYTIGSSTTNVSATIVWTTNELSNSTVNYGTDSSNLASSAYNTTMALSHTVYITSVINGSTYYYEVVSADSSNNTRTDNNGGSNYQFIPAATTTQQITLTLGWNLISIPLS